MILNEKLWDAIESLAKIKGYSTSGLAKESGLDPTIFNKSKRVSQNGKKRWPTTESIAKILETTNYTMGQFAALMQACDTGLILSKIKLSKPVLASKKSGTLPYHKVTDVSNALETIDIDNDSHVLEINTKDYMPFFQKGDTVILSRTLPPKKKDIVAIKFQDNTCILAHFSKMNTHAITITPLVEAEKKDVIILPLATIEWTGVVRWKKI